MRAALLAAYALCIVGMVSGCDDKDSSESGKPGSSHVIKAPELDPNGMAASLGLLIGTILVIVSRRKK